jgi:hypothetical protein
MTFFLALALQAATGAPPPPKPPAPVILTPLREQVGAFSVVREDPDGAGPNETRVSLVWRSPDGASEVRFDDDGFAVAKSYVMRPKAGAPCISGRELAAHGKGRATGRYWTADRANFLGFVRHCSGAQGLSLTAFEAGHDRAAGDFAAALDRFKAVAAETFGGLAPRCVSFGDGGANAGRGGCARFSS